MWRRAWLRVRGASCWIDQLQVVPQEAEAGVLGMFVSGARSQLVYGVLPRVEIWIAHGNTACPLLGHGQLRFKRWFRQDLCRRGLKAAEHFIQRFFP